MGMHVGKLLAAWRQTVSLAARIAHADNVLRELSTATDDVEAARRPPAAERRRPRRGVRSRARRHPLTSPWWTMETP
jgi:hypothetical protein